MDFYGPSDSSTHLSPTCIYQGWHKLRLSENSDLREIVYKKMNTTKQKSTINISNPTPILDTSVSEKSSYDKSYVVIY